MALTPGSNVPSSISGTGSSARASLLANHIFNAGLEQPEILRDLIVKFPQFWFNDLLESVPDVSGTLTSREYTWQILDRTRKGTVLTYVSGTGTAAVVADTDIAAADPDLGYYLIGDVLRCANTGINYRVTVVEINGGLQRLTIARFDGGNIVQADVDGFSFGHISSDFASGSSASGGTRVHLPGTDSAFMNIHRVGWTIERGAIAQKTYVDDKSWYFNQEDIEQKEFMRSFQAKMLFGKLNKTRTGVAQTKGLMEYAEDSGQKVTFSEGIGVQEADYIELVEALIPQGGSDDYVMLMGNRIFLQTQKALANAHYQSIPNSDKPAQIAGLDFQSYQIGGKKLHFKMFDVFSDQSIVPQVTPTAIAKDFRNVALALDLGQVSPGQRNIQVKYLEGAKFIQKAIDGMASQGMSVASAYDGLQMELLTEFLVACLLPNRLGLVYANS